VDVKQSGWLQNLWTDAGTCVHCTNICPRHQPLWPATWSSASLTHGQAYNKTSSTKQLVNGEYGYLQAWGKRTSLWTYAKLKPALFRATTLHNRLFSESPTVYRGKHAVSPHFRCSYLKTNKVSKSESWICILFLELSWSCWPNIIKISPCLSKLQLAVLGAFFLETQCSKQNFEFQSPCNVHHHKLSPVGRDEPPLVGCWFHWNSICSKDSLIRKLYQMICYKNLAIANRSHVNCAHNTSRATTVNPWPWNPG